MIKKLILFILLSLCLVFQASAWNPMITTSGTSGTSVFSCTGYDICQNLEAVGYDNGETWNETLNQATIDENYSASPIVGAQSLQVVDGGTDGNVYATVDTSGFSDGDTLYGYFQVRVDTDTTGAIVQMVNFYDWSSDVGDISLSDAGAINSHHGSVSDTGSTNISGGGVFHIWWEFKTETGAGDNGVLKVWVSATSTKPETPEIDASDGNGDFVAIDRYYIWARGASTIVYDKILIDRTQIGSF